MRSHLVLCKSLILALLLSSSVRAANVDDAANALRDTLSEVMPGATFRFHRLPNGVVLRGTVAGRQDVQLVQQIANNYFPIVINEVETTGTRDGDSSVDRKSGDIVKGEGAQRLNAKLQEIYPGLQLSTVEIPNAVVLFGEVEASRDIKTILKIAEQYFPKVISAIAFSDDDVSTKLRPSEPGDRMPSDRLARRPAARTEPSEIDQLRAEVRGLRDDVQRLIRSLEAGNEDGNTSISRDGALGVPKAVMEDAGRAANTKWMLSLQDVIALAIRNSDLAGMVSTHHEPGGRPHITVKRTDDQLAPNQVVERLTHMVREVERTYRQYCSAWESLDAARVTLDAAANAPLIKRQGQQSPDVCDFPRKFDLYRAMLIEVRSLDGVSKPRRLTD